ncbi:phosphotransferase enzyme family protein [Brevibacterium litoralis]|uniref:phosphotransferase enzyme family protein n=1 Tax=Brevibacterium litoralis TaxID=3138935 RepID=UPI0032F07BE6
MTQTVSADPFTAFAMLRRGDPAPGWLLRAVTSGWGLDPDRTRARLIAVSENATFRLEVDGAPTAVLRLHRPGHVRPDQISSELAWVRALAQDTDVRVPEVLPLDDGSLVLPVAQTDGADPWCVVAFAFIEGEVVEDLADPRPYYRRLGEITAKFHRHSTTWERPEGFDRFSWDLGDMLGPTSRWGDWRDARMSPDQRDLFEAAEARARDTIAGLSTSETDRGLIHADLRPSNIMSTGPDLTVIDFDDCGIGWYLYDFASALTFIEHEPYAPDLARDWVAGYSGVSRLDDEALAHACALSMIRRLQMVGWTTTHREDALPPAVWHAQVPGTATVARKFLDSPTWLLD